MSAQQSSSASPVSREQQALVQNGQIPPLLNGDPILDFDVEMSNAGDEDVSRSSVVGDNNSDVNVNINVELTASILLESAKEDLDRKKNKYYVSLGNYLTLSKVDPSADATKAASLVYKQDQDLFKEAEETLKVLKASNTPAVAPSDKKSMLVPGNLPFLQLKSDPHQEKANREVFDSVYDFCQEFTTVLEAHALSLDASWERLLPMCLNKEERSWFEDKLKGKSLGWKVAESALLDHYDTPFRKFLNMGRVWSMKQGANESARSFGAKFQKFRRQATLEDGVQLVLCFWWNLRPEVRKACMIPLSANYGTKMPSKIEDIISLVNATTVDSSSLLLNPGETSSISEWKSFAAGNGASSSSSSSSGNKGKKRAFSSGDAGKKHKKAWDFKSALKDNVCFSCKSPWEKGHSCAERERHALAKVSRMALRSSGGEGSTFPGRGEASSSSSSEDDNTSALAQMALDCKYNYKEMVIKKDFKNMSTNITFPILANNSIRTISLLDCGATFSSVDKNFCLKNSLPISYVTHVNKKFVNKSNVHEYFIRLADSNTYIKRIGTCIISVTCNSKTIKREFEVMNLTNSNEYDFSIGTDYMFSLGIGIYGLPLTYDDEDSSEERREADRRFNNKSDLLESIERENELKENNPAVGPKEFEEAMDYIQKFVKNNQAIPKGSFCTIPESVVCLDTPENATAFRSPYPIPFKMQGVVDEQVKEWLENGIIERAPANTEWNTPLTVVKKTNGKGEITGYRVCHDPRLVNTLLKTIDRMPLPVIGELFEDLKGANIYSTLDLKSAFNSLRLNPKDAHKLSFTWRGVQYKPIGTVFGIKHVSSQFQRTMSIALEGLPFVRFFVDDIVCASKTFEEHKVHLKQVIERLTRVNLKLNPKKCHFFQKEIYLLGFHISPKGITMDRRKLVNVLEFPQPKTGKDIQSYCGLINYFRTLIPNVSSIMSPLDSLRNEKSITHLWTDKHQTAFNNLKKALLSDLVLSYPDMNSRFCISCDASLTGIGAVLYQVRDGKTKYISFVAKSLSKSERKYSATKRELLALVFALKRFHKYIYGSSFTLYTDHKALTYLHTQRVANLMMIAWMDTILQYDFKIVHLPGVANVLPDALSRLSEETEPLLNELGGDNEVKSIMRNSAVTKEPLPDVLSGEYFTPPTENQRNKLLVEEHLKGHFGIEAILHALKRKGIYWTNLKSQANDLIQSCIQCQRHNITRKGYNPLRPITATLPGDSWGIDLAGPFTMSTKGNEYLLVMIDIASKFYVLRAIPDKSMATVALQVLDIIGTWGPMRKLQSDCGREFVNSLMTSIKENVGFEHALISQYHPRANGASERAVQSAVNTIKKQIVGNVADWDLKVPSAQLFLNSKYNARTKSTPFSLMFGRNPNDFVDFGKEKDNATAEKIREDLKGKIKRMTEIVYPAVYENVKHVTEKQKKSFDTSHKMIDLKPGSTVMILVTEKQNKLDPKYKGFYTVVRKTAANTYVLKNEKGFLEPRNYPPSLLKKVSDKISEHKDEFFEVEAIIGHKKDDNNKYMYRCKWFDYDESYDSWEPEDNFTDPKFIKEYWQRIGEVPESVKEINKANKRLLKSMNIATPQNSGTKRKRITRSVSQNKKQSRF